MTLWMNLLVQLLGIVGSSATVFTNLVPDKYKPLVVLVLTLAQAAAAFIAHQYNPDGTKAIVSYVKKS